MPSRGWWTKHVEVETPGVINERALTIFDRWIGPLVRLVHRPSVEGLEHLPESGPFLLVANHSGGIAISEILCLLALRQANFRHVRLAAVAHPISFRLWPLTAIMRMVGAIPSSYEAAQDALSKGAGILIFPGGDHEAMRPFWRAHQVDFNGRKGFLRIAQRADCPLIPMGIRGSHLSVPILWRSTRVLPWLLLWPKLIGLKRYAMTLSGLLGTIALLLLGSSALGWPLAIALSWFWLGSLGPLLPILPVRVQMRIGPPVEHSADLEVSYDRAVAAVQALVSLQDR